LAIPVFNPLCGQPEKPIIVFFNITEAENYMRAENYKRAINGKEKLYAIQCTIEIPVSPDNYVSRNNQLKMF